VSHATVRSLVGPVRLMWFRRRRVTVVAALLSICGACENGASSGAAQGDVPSATAGATETDFAAADVVLFTGETREDLEVGGYGFRQAEISSPGPTIEARAGEPLTIGLRNVHGYVDNEQIDHDFAVVDQKSELSEPLWGSQTETVDPGQADVVTFTPSEPGRYFYICTLSGHLSAHGMWGRFVVE
jgi:uncharacterized cupredoxin-like copper-binding protein